MVSSLRMKKLTEATLSRAGFVDSCRRASGGTEPLSPPCSFPFPDQTLCVDFKRCCQLLSASLPAELGGHVDAPVAWGLLILGAGQQNGS